ncbi:MAG: PIN domain-containing protein [Planctomycetes bacterium]|nr:PIN domain-containing protein [Planctomycetota bacterium]
MDAIDVHILIWGLRNQLPPDPERASLPARCAKLIEKLPSPILLPSVALGEYLIGCDPDTRDQELDEIARNYFVAPFDDKAAAIAAEIWDNKVVDRVKREAKIGKQAVKADIQILATAIAQGATSLYVEDRHYNNFLQDKIIIKSIPTEAELSPQPEPKPQKSPSAQKELFDDDGDIE